MVFTIEFDRALEAMKVTQGVPVLIILILRVHLMIINMKIDGMENNFLRLPGSLVQIEAIMRGRCLVLSAVLVG